MAEPTPRGGPPIWLVAGAVLALIALAWIAPMFAPYDPRLSTGRPLLPPDRDHLLGTNDIGQDVLSEWLWGARSTLQIVLLVTLLSTALSWSIGVAAGMWRGLEGPLLGLTDLLLALPSIPLYLLIVAAAGPSRRNVVLTLGLLSWPAFARIVRAQTMALRGQPYVEAARAMGAVPLRIATVHVLPGTLSLLPAKLVLTFRYAMFAEATLAFLGLGDSTDKSWGTMLSWAFNYPLLFIGRAWLWWALPPAIAIILVVLATTWLASVLGPSSTTLHRGQSRVTRLNRRSGRIVDTGHAASLGTGRHSQCGVLDP